MLGVKVELNSASVTDTKQKFKQLLDGLQQTANKTVIKINVDMANLRSVNALLTQAVTNLNKLNNQQATNQKTMSQMVNTMRTMAKLQNEVSNGGSSNGKSGGGIGGFGLGNLTEWLLLRKGIQLAMDELRQGVQFSLDMNKAMTDISIVYNMTQGQVDQLAQSYNELAKSMAVSTAEIAKASVEYYRQGLTTEQVNQRMKQTIEYAKVSGLALDEASTILTATVNSMDIDIKRASDVFSYLGDATATGADEIGRAFQKVGGTASALDVNFEKVSSWIATISSKTREGAETIGNSIKNIMARFEQLRQKGFTDEDQTNVNQVSKALKEVGIQMMTSDGQFRNFGDVMDELGAKWQNLDSRHKAYIATTLAGTNQQSRFLNLMNNYQESVGLYDKSLESAGVTQQKYNLYLQGTEAHMNQLKASAEGVWLKIFNGKDMRDSIDSLKSMVDFLGSLIDRFGALPTLITTATSAFFAFNNNVKAFNAKLNISKDYGTMTGVDWGFSIKSAWKKSIDEYSEAIQKLRTNVRELPNGFQVISTNAVTMGMRFRALTATTIAQTVATGALKFASMALNAVIGMGIGIIISGMVSAIQSWINKSKEQREEVEKMIDDYNQATAQINDQKQALSALKNEYDSLKGKTNLTTEETKRFNEVQNEIAKISPDMIDYYDKQGNAILKMGTNIDEVIEKLNQENKFKAIDMVNGFGKAKEVYTKEAEGIITERKKLEQELADDVNGFTKDNLHFDGLNDLRQQMGLLAQEGKTDTEEYRNLSKAETELNEKVQGLNLKIEEQNAKLNKAKEVIDPYRDSMLLLSTGYDKLSGSAKSLAKDLVYAIDAEKLSISEVQKVVDKMNGNDMKNALKSLDSLKLDKGKMGVDDYNKRLVEVMDTLQKLTGLSTDKLQTLFDARPIKDTKDAVSDLKQEMQGLTEQFGGATSKIEDYNKYLDELNDKHILSATSVKDIMSKYPELINYLGNEAELRQQLAQLIQNEEQVQQDAYVAMLEMSEQFYNEKVRGTGILQQKLGEYYSSDLENYKSLAEAKQHVDNSLIQGLAKSWGNYFSVVNDQIAVQDQLFDNIMGETDAMSGAKANQLSRLRRQISSAQSQISDVANRFKNITVSISPINFDKINLSKNSSGGGSKGSSSVYESNLDPMDKFESYLKDINAQLEKQDDLIKSIADEAKIYKDAGDRQSLLKALELETKEYTEQSRKLATLKQDSGLLNTQLAVLAQTFKSNWGAMAGANLSNWTEVDFDKMLAQLFPSRTFKSKSAQQSYEDQKKYFQKLVDDWFKYKDQITKTNDDILSTQNDMLSLMQERYDTYFSIIQQSFDKLTQSMDDTKSSMDMLNESENFDEREKLAQELVAKTTTYRDTIQKAIDTLIEHRNKLTQNSTEWNIVNNQITEYEKTLQEANKDLKDANDLIYQIQQSELSTASNLQDKIVDALKSKYEKAKQDELDAVEKKKQEDIDKANAELEQLKKELADLQDETADKQDQLAKEKAELELWKKDNSAYAQGKVKELEADIAKREKELAIDAKQKEIDDKQTEIDNINKNAEDETKIIEDKYAKLLNDQALYEEALKIMQTQTQDEILELLKTYDEKYAELGETLGKAYADAMKKEIQQAMDALTALQNGMASVVTPEAPDEPPTPPETPPSAPAPTPPPAPSASAPASPNIAWDGLNHSTRSNSRGDAVRRIQENLNAIGYHLAVDGIFGSKTRNAVVDFQRKHGLSADGIVGRNTWAKLIKFDTGGYTGDWGLESDGKVAVLHKKERVLTPLQTKAFEHLIYDILPKFYNQTAMNKLEKMANIVFNEPVVKNDIKIVNNTPFDVSDNMDNLNKAIKQELKTAGFRINLVK